MKTSQLKTKDVIRMCDGSIVGQITDFEFDPTSFQIQAVCIKERFSLWQELFSVFRSERVMIVDVSKIVQIGKDVVFAQLPSSEKR